MSNDQTEQVWEKIVQILDDKLQYGFLEQVRSIVRIEMQESTLTLTVASEEARDFFNAEVNKNRLMLLARPVIHLDSIVSLLAEAELLE